MYSGYGFRESEIGDVDVVKHDGVYHLFHMYYIFSLSADKRMRIAATSVTSVSVFISLVCLAVTGLIISALSIWSGPPGADGFAPLILTGILLAAILG
jgi:hypothetical protein